jgi:hypothetical protein
MKLFNSITLICLIAINLALPTENDSASSKFKESAQDINANAEITGSSLSSTNSAESDDFTNHEEVPIDFEEIPKLRTIIPGFRIPIIDSIIESAVRPVIEGAIINPINNIIGNNKYDEQTEEDMMEFLNLLHNIKH